MLRALTCSLVPVLTVALVGLLGVSLPKNAEACGGFFCNNTTLIAVDQTKERILFEVNGDGSLTVNVEITFVGAAEDFSWVVPVPQSFDGSLGVLPPSTLRLLDAATAPRVIPPQQYGWGDEEAFDSAPGNTTGDDDDDNVSGEDDVDVTNLPQVGPYAPQLVSSSDASALTTWLNENGYLITEEMEPLVAQYVVAGMNFLAMKLAPDSEVQEIAPIAITYEADSPMIPLVLTAVAAEPEMGVLVFVAGDQRYEPANYEGLFVDTELLQADPRTGETNYYPLISYLSDQFNRQTFFTEYSDSSSNLNNTVQNTWIGSDDQEEAWDYVGLLAKRHGWVSRLYTRMSNVDMTTDPLFQGVGTTPVSNVYDLSDHDPVHIDFSVDPPLACNDTYCGVGGVCASTESGTDGCVCGGGYSARRIEAPNVSSLGGQPTVTCQDNSFDMLASAVDTMGTDVCASYSCGDQGTCVVLGGFPTCQCPVGTAASPSNDGMITCSPVIDTFGPEQVLWPLWPPSAHEDELGPENGGAAALAAGCASGCSTATAGQGPIGLLSLLFLLVLARRRQA